ncbi:TetR family transcriptional regulator [Streptomyces tremellae]|uniref:TetR family transcriptional regulator n=1 Tax=Streptomyces tremellae TaxID=1124239 RepID=UPI003CD05B6C
MNTPRTRRTTNTRQAIMAAAERLIAEHGPAAVSNRQIAEAAGQRNVTAVSYHFGDRITLIGAIMARHGEQVDRIRQLYVSQVEGSDPIRGWVGCLVRPVTDHLAGLGAPSWNARFSVQVMTDPLMRNLVMEDVRSRPHLWHILDALGSCLTHLPAPVRAARGDMARHLITHTCAERERALAEGAAPLHRTWEDTADMLVDALVGLLTAEVTLHRTTPDRRSAPTREEPRV